MSDDLKFQNSLNSVLNYFDATYALAHIDRYSMEPVIKHETVAEHSYFVALCVVLLHDIYYFDLPLALLAAICHDVPEMEISDVNHVVKKRYPEIAQAIKSAETDIISRMPPTLKTGAELYNTMSTEAQIVHLADAMQCMQYSQCEMKLGNTGYMVDVYQNSKERAAIIHEELKGSRR